MVPERNAKTLPTRVHERLSAARQAAAGLVMPQRDRGWPHPRARYLANGRRSPSTGGWVTRNALHAAPGDTRPRGWTTGPTRSKIALLVRRGTEP